MSFDPTFVNSLMVYSLTDIFQHLLGIGCTGHWVVLHGIDHLEEQFLNSLLKHLAAYWAIEY